MKIQIVTLRGNCVQGLEVCSVRHTLRGSRVAETRVMTRVPMQRHRDHERERETFPWTYFDFRRLLRQFHEISPHTVLRARFMVENN
jgi:hypothetical protein